MTVSMDAAVRRVVGPALDHGPGEAAERLGRIGLDPDDPFEATDVGEPDVERGHEGRDRSQLGANGVGQLHLREEREEDRDVRLGALRRGKVPPVADRRPGPAGWRSGSRRR